jgi:hypothetical protein
MEMPDQVHFELGMLFFSSEDVQYGVFAAIAGRGSSKIDLHIYLFAIASSGLQLARVRASAMKNLNTYEYFDPASCSFRSAPPSQVNAMLSSVYLCGGFSSGRFFYTPFLKDVSSGLPVRPGSLNLLHTLP